ncbi:MAG TPA: DNA recombination protein RmuC [Burkholderiales bacterium]|jgi:DNA recombination protein RmuC
MSASLILTGTALLLIAGGIGWLVATLRHQRRITELATTLELERNANRAHEQESQQKFAALSAQALRENSSAFLQLAQESLKQMQLQGSHDLATKEKAVEDLVKPLREALEKSEAQIRRVEQERQQAYGSLTKHLETVAQTQQLLHGETRNLVQALRRPEVRGQWGELTLRRLVELAGMVEHCDFYEQPQLDTEEGRRRPDMVVRMPDGREIIVDVKTPLDAYLSAIEAPDEDTRRHHLEQHARKVRERVRELAAKAYWNQFPRAPDFILLFIPGEQFLAAALDLDHALLEDALSQRIILTTPTSFVALLRAVAYGWRQEQLAANAERIREVGEELYHRLAVFADHLARLGKGLDTAVDNYNRAVGSFETKVLTGARRFTELGVTPTKALDEPSRIETGLRKMEEKLTE